MFLLLSSLVTQCLHELQLSTVMPEIPLYSVTIQELSQELSGIPFYTY